MHKLQCSIYNVKYDFWMVGNNILASIKVCRSFISFWLWFDTIDDDDDDAFNEARCTLCNYIDNECERNSLCIS